ncbi:MAG: hypothetical protein D6704_02615 [Nitrospirae bacterium]|nr:MAG: hypothetical protein D6704_02615 [Nitrospirota bacterium]
MRKVVGLVVLLGGVFWCGYYLGQQPPEQVKRTLQTLSGEVVERTLGIETNDLLRQKAMLQAKARLLQSKIRVLQGQYQQAAEELSQSMLHLKETMALQREKSAALLRRLMAKLDALQRTLLAGDPTAQEQIEDAQHDLDTLIEQP